MNKYRFYRFIYDHSVFLTFIIIIFICFLSGFLIAVLPISKFMKGILNPIVGFVIGVTCMLTLPNILKDWAWNRM